MDLQEWATEIGEAYKAACGERQRFDAVYAIPEEFDKASAENAALVAIHEQMPRAAIEVWVDGHSRLNVRRHPT